MRVSKKISVKKNKKSSMVATSMKTVQVLTEEQATLLEKTKTYWFFGEWQAISGFLRDRVTEDHPEAGQLY